MPHSFGIDVASDWADKADDDPVFGLYRRCGLWTMDEAQILYWCAKAFPGQWLDIGSHVGWTTAHIAMAGCKVLPLDPLYRDQPFANRLLENLGNTLNANHDWVAENGCGVYDERFDGFCYATSGRFFEILPGSGHPTEYAGICIDGDHSPGKPLEDAINSVKHLAERGVILFHDATGYPVQEAVEYCVAQGFSCKAYITVHGVVVCWRGEFTPPAHRPDGRCAPVIDRLGALKRFV